MKRWRRRSKNPPDLALLDMNYQRDSTSGIEGLELIQHLRELDSTVPIIALTAWGNVDLAVSAMKHGASDFIEKPWRNDCPAGESAVADPAGRGATLVAARLGVRAQGRASVADAHRAAAPSW